MLTAEAPNNPLASNAYEKQLAVVETDGWSTMTFGSRSKLACRVCRCVTRGSGNDDAHGPRWIGLALGDLRHNWEATVPAAKCRNCLRERFVALPQLLWPRTIGVNWSHCWNVSIEPRIIPPVISGANSCSDRATSI